MSTKCIVTLYVEGGEHDGVSFACGPYDSLFRADREAEFLSRFGTAISIPLSDSTDVHTMLAKAENAG